MIGAAEEPVLVRDIEIPQNPMQEFRTVVRIQEILVADFQIDREPRFPYRIRTRAKQIGRIICLEDRVAIRSEQIARPSDHMMQPIPRPDIRIAQPRLEQWLNRCRRRKLLVAPKKRS